MGIKLIFFFVFQILIIVATTLTDVAEDLLHSWVTVVEIHSDQVHEEDRWVAEVDLHRWHSGLTVADPVVDQCLCEDHVLEVGPNTFPLYNQVFIYFPSSLFPPYCW